MSEGESTIYQEEEIQYQETDSLNFDQVKKGSKILIFADDELDKLKTQPDYEIEVTGIRKNGLLVSVKPAYRRIFGDFTARTPGVIIGAYHNTPEVEYRGPLRIAEGQIKVTDETALYKLYFENPKDLDGDKIARTIFSAPIRKILFKE